MKRAHWIGLGLLALWLAVALVTAGHHEMWRDEVRPLTLAREASSPLDLYRRVQYDGHPMLWFLLLQGAHAVLHTKLILPGLSLLMAAAAVAVLLLAAPLPLPLRALFVFGALPLYEYAVMARNYGIAMLLLVLAAAAFPRREVHPWRLALALALALLANTNLHSAILACLLAGVWIWEARGVRSLRKLSGPMALVALGVAVSLLCAFPRPTSNLTTVYSVSPGRIARALLESARLPDWTFFLLLPSSLPGLVNRLILVLAMAGLLARPPLALAAAGSALSLGVLFRVGYFGSYRHQGLFLVFLVALYWIAAASAPAGRRRWLLTGGLYLGLLPLLLAQLARTPGMIREDLTQARSSSPALAAFLQDTPSYHEAVLLPEPAWYLESLPYYAPNTLYFPREDRYGTTVSWTDAQRKELSLGDLLRSARAVEHRTGHPALIVLGSWDLTAAPAAEKRGDYGQTFSWSAAELEEFRRMTVPVADFRAAVTDENYTVYALRPVH